MRHKYISLALVCTLSACSFGGKSDNSSLFNIDWNNINTEFKPGQFDATPDAARKANKSITQTATLLDYTDRVIDIYDQANQDGNMDTMIEYFVVGCSSSGCPDDITADLTAELINNAFVDANDEAKTRLANMSPEKQKKLAYAEYAYQLLQFAKEAPDSINVSELDTEMDLSGFAITTIINLINAYYYVESNGKITQKLNATDLVAPGLPHPTWREYADFISDVDWDTLLKRYHNTQNGFLGGVSSDIGSDFATLSDGKILALGDHFVRIGDTNTFKDNFHPNINIEATVEMVGNNKFKYNDFGIATVTKFDDDGETILKQEKHLFFHSAGKLDTSIDKSMLPADWNFKGTAVGLYTKNAGVPIPSYLEMRTDNATLNITLAEGTVQSTLKIPFSESGWYDVTYTSGSLGENYMFNNYKGADANRLLNDTGNGVVVMDPVDGDMGISGDYAFDQPNEVIGNVKFENGPEQFEAGYLLSPDK